MTQHSVMVMYNSTDFTYLPIDGKVESQGENWRLRFRLHTFTLWKLEYPRTEI